MGYKNGNKLEKYYTSNKIADIMRELLETYWQGETSEFLENSAGSGNLIDYLRRHYDTPIIAYDILNETGREDIKECDYLKEKIPYKKGRVAFINPPFQKGLKFIYKALEECDYCIAVLRACSFLSIDYNKYNTDKIIIVPRTDFEDFKGSVCIVAIKKSNHNV